MARSNVQRFLLSLLLASSVIPAFGEDRLLVEARAKLYTERDEIIAKLEGAVSKYPGRVEYWVELLNALTINSDRFVAECVSREALRLNPGSPDLLLARARLLPPGGALDVLDALERIPGHEMESRDARELLLLDLPIPKSWQERNFYGGYGGWVPKLMANGQWKRAETIVERGLAMWPDDKRLFACQAMILAERGELQAAMKSQELSGYQQGKFCPEWPGWCLGDVLLAKGHPELAVESFGGIVPEADDQESARLVLAWSLLELNDDELANQVLEKCRGSTPTLLRIGSLVKHKKLDEARDLGNKLTQPWTDPDYDFFWLGELSRAWPNSLTAPLTNAASWLVKEFPKRAGVIERKLGHPSKALRHTWYLPPKDRTRAIPDLRNHRKITSLFDLLKNRGLPQDLWVKSRPF